MAVLDDLRAVRRLVSETAPSSTEIAKADRILALLLKVLCVSLLVATITTIGFTIWTIANYDAVPTAELKDTTSTAPIDDLVWRDAPHAWHQQAARIVDHRFSTFTAMKSFARDAKKAGVSILMLVSVQKTSKCPGPWYNGLQLCDHINGSYPVASGSLAQWKRMLAEIAPMRLMWWNNPVRPPAIQPSPLTLG